MKTKMTRADYMADSRNNHRTYYAQFVTPYVKQLVASKIGVARLVASKDPHLNDIPLAVWDSFWVCTDGGMHIRPGFAIGALLKEAGEGNSVSTGTCILKEAARQLIEDHGNQPTYA